MSLESQNRIFDILRGRGLLSSSIQKVIQGFMDRWGVDAFRAMIETNVVEESKMADVLSEALKLPRLRGIASLAIPPEVFACIPYNLALELVVFPFELTSESRLHVVFADPSDSAKLKKLIEYTNKPIEQFVGERTEIIAAIQRHYPLTLQLPSLLSGRGPADEGHNP